MSKTTPGQKAVHAISPPAFHLDLTIGRDRYSIERLVEALRPGGRAFRLVKGDGTIYDVAESSYGPQCDCPDYLFRREGLDPAGCKHIKALVGSGLMEPSIVRNPVHLQTRRGFSGPQG